MREESHLEEMRAALRGERERANDARRRLPLASVPPEREPEPEAAQDEPRSRRLRSLFRRR